MTLRNPISFGHKRDRCGSLVARHVHTILRRYLYNIFRKNHLLVTYSAKTQRSVQIPPPKSNSSTNIQYPSNVSITLENCFRIILSYGQAFSNESKLMGGISKSLLHNYVNSCHVGPLWLTYPGIDTPILLLNIKIKIIHSSRKSCASVFIFFDVQSYEKRKQ